MTAPLAAWANVSLALMGPAVVAVAATQAGPNLPVLVANALGLAAIALIALAVITWAILGEGYRWRRLGLGNWSLLTPLSAIALTAFFVFVFGPLASWALAGLGDRGFAPGIETAIQLPTAYLTLTIVVVAAAEELLYRGYAIERLFDLTGSYLVASAVSVIAFGLAHVPMWGLAAAATTIASGGILTGIYVWRRDLVALILAHIATDVCGLVIAPQLARAATGSL